MPSRRVAAWRRQLDRFDAHAVARSLAGAGAAAIGLEWRPLTEDRKLLEEVILPEYARRAEVRRVLFVGCARYTVACRRIFSHAEYWTIDPVPSRRRYGSDRHIVDGLQHLEAYVPADYLDLVVCNGVFGWGLDAKADCEAAFDACRRCLRAGGELVLGWNDVPARRPFPPESLAALRAFEPVTFAPLAAHRHLTETRNRHTYDFYARHP